MNRGLLPSKRQDGGPLRTHPYAKTLQGGGDIDDELMTRFKESSQKDETFKKRARLHYYKQVLDAELAKKNPEAWTRIDEQRPISGPLRDRTALAGKLIDDDSFAYALNDEEIKTILGAKYDDFNTLRSWSAETFDAGVTGEGEEGTQVEQTRYGLRNSWAIPDTTYSSTYNTKPYIIDKAEIAYNPADDSYSYKYTRTDRSKMSKESIKKKLQTQDNDEFNRTPRFNTGGLLKKKGKVGNPENRDKPGGSNVGKYSKSEGPFAGPSGWAPAGSYPIGSKTRGKSALKLAHNAPNPTGIKSAVYRKYPDIKPGKAARGSKLGMNETGVLQGSYPVAPPARRYLLKKKDRPQAKINK